METSFSNYPSESRLILFPTLRTVPNLEIAPPTVRLSRFPLTPQLRGKLPLIFLRHLSPPSRNPREHKLKTGGYKKFSFISGHLREKKDLKLIQWAVRVLVADLLDKVAVNLLANVLTFFPVALIYFSRNRRAVGTF